MLLSFLWVLLSIRERFDLLVREHFANLTRSSETNKNEFTFQVIATLAINS